MVDETPDPYNPLGRMALGESVVRALLDQPCHPLPPANRFKGVGIYALYYQGEFSPYAPISSPDCGTPIYVGKASPPGSRSGLGGLRAHDGRELHSRLRGHAASIDAATNLSLDEFSCRYLVVEDIWIPLGESLLIRRFRPVWNSVVHGFGLNDPGRHRYGGDRSDWDEIHPGRPWRDAMRLKRTGRQVLDDVRAHFTEADD